VSELEAVAEARKLRNDELQNSCPPHVPKAINPRGIRWAGHVSCVGELRGGWVQNVGRKTKGRPHESVCRKMLLRWLLCMADCELGSSASG
jgi:hypothetical protein